MKHWYYLLLLGLAIVLTACSSGSNILPQTGEELELRFEDLPQAAQAAVESLSSELGVPVEQISIVEVTPMEWPDACLNLPSTGEECAQVLTEGFSIMVEVDGQEYELHTDEAGVNIRRK